MNKFKMLLLSGILLASQPAWAYHNFFFRSANDITSGILDSLRLDASSVTMRGNSWDDQVDASTTALRNDFNLSTGIISAQLALVDVSGVPQTYQIIIGTLTSRGVHIASNTEDGLQEAVRQLCGAANATTCYGGNIFFKQGRYLIGEATIPANVHVYAVPGTSVTWMAGSGANGTNTITNYGWIEGINHDGRLASIASWPYMNLKSGSKWTNFTAVNWNTASNINSKIFQLEQATNVVINGFISNINIPAVVTAQNDSAPFAIKYSSDVDMVLNTGSCRSYQQNSGAFRIEGSARIKLHDSRWDNAGGAWIGIQNQNIDIEIRNNFMNITQDNDGSGAISLAGVGNNPVTQGSTGTVIAENRFLVSFAGTGNPIINFGQNGGAKMAVVRGNEIISAQDLSGANFVFAVTRGVAVVGTLFQHNRVYNRGPGTGLSLVSDGGSNTNFTGATGGNYVNNIQQ